MVSPSPAAESPSAPSAIRFADVASQGVLSRFLRGAGFAAGGIAFARSHPRVLLWALIPMAIQGALLVTFLQLTLSQVKPLTDRFGPEPGHWYSFLGMVLLLGLAFGSVLLSNFAAILVGGVVCDPFFDLISESTEAIILGRTVGEPFSLVGMVSGLVGELVITVVRLTVFLSVAIPLWIVGLTGVGSVIAAPLGLLWTWAFVALEGLSRSQGRHALGARDRLGVLKHQTVVSLGFGAVGWLMAFVPFTAPLLVVSGTRMFLALAAHDRVPSALTAEEKASLRA